MREGDYMLKKIRDNPTHAALVVGMTTIVTWLIRKAIVEPADAKQSESVAAALARSAESVGGQPLEHRTV